MMLSWFICYILTLTNAIPDDPDHWAYRGRTDIQSDVLKEADWFRVPYPGKHLLSYMRVL